MEDRYGTFRDRYITSFLASYAAVKYDENCLLGWTGSEKQPVEDAMYLADEAWAQLLDVETKS